MAIPQSSASGATTPRSLAVAQTVPIRGDVTANVRQHVELVELAVDTGADVIVFPELSTTGYELDLARELAFSEDDTRLAPLVTAAERARATLVVGAPIRIGPRRHIGAFVIGPRGAIDVVTKQRLGAFPPSAHPDGAVPPPESSVFEPGDRAPLVRCGDLVVAVAICADTNRPAHPRSAVERGGTAYVASVFVPPTEMRAEHAKLSGYAREHAVVAAMSNYGGPTGGLRGGGGSAIWAPGGEAIVRLPADGCGIAVATNELNADAWRSHVRMLEST